MNILPSYAECTIQFAAKVELRWIKMSWFYLDIVVLFTLFPVLPFRFNHWNGKLSFCICHSHDKFSVSEIIVIRMQARINWIQNQYAFARCHHFSWDLLTLLILITNHIGSMIVTGMVSFFSRAMHRCIHVIHRLNGTGYGYNCILVCNENQKKLCAKPQSNRERMRLWYLLWKEKKKSHTT